MTRCRGRVRRALVDLTRGRDAAKEEADASARDRRLLERFAEFHADFSAHFDRKRMEEDFLGAFRDYGLDVDALDPATAGARIAARPAAVEIAAILDHWVFNRRELAPPDAAGAGRLVAVAKLADPDPWRNQLRHALERNDSEVLHRLVASADLDLLPVQSVTRLAWALRVNGEPGAAVKLLVPLQRRHRDDFWVNTDLADNLAELGPPRADEALRYRIAAASLRPRGALTLAKLGQAYASKGMRHEAIAEHLEAVRLNPDIPWIRESLAGVLRSHDDPDAALAPFRDAVRSRPDDALAHRWLGFALVTLSRPDEAVAAYREAARLAPGDAHVRRALALALRTRGAVDEAEAELREALRLRPEYVTANLLGILLAEQRKNDEAFAAFRAAIRLPSDGDFAARFNLSDLFKRTGRLDEAFATISEIDRLRPGMGVTHLKLGDVLEAQGKHAEAEEAYREAIRIEPNHAEALARLDALARLPAVLRGDGRPRNAAEGVAFASLCIGRDLKADAVRLLVDALGADPTGADDLAAAHRYNAACLATLAASGTGEGGPPLDEDRARWRRHALDWLRADLALMRRRLESGSPLDRNFVAVRLQLSKVDADLISVRDAREVAKLPGGEQAAWRALWEEIDTLRRRAAGDRPAGSPAGR